MLKKRKLEEVLGEVLPVSKTKKCKRGIDFLRQVPLLKFMKLNDERLKELENAMEIHKFPASKFIFRAGEKSEYFFLIFSGTVQILQDSIVKESNVIASLTTLDFFGEAALLSHADPNFDETKSIVLHQKSAYAKSNTVCYVLPRQQFYMFFEDNPHTVFSFPRRQLVAVSAEKYASMHSKEFDGEKKEKESKKLTPSMIKFLLDCTKSNICFTNFTYKIRRAIVKHMKPMHVKKNSVLIECGEIGENFYVIEQGKFISTKHNTRNNDIDNDNKGNNNSIRHMHSLDLAQTLNNNDSKIIFNISEDITTLSRGSCFGDLALMYPGPATSTVKCVEDSVVYYIDRFLFKNLARNCGIAQTKRFAAFLRNVPLFATLATYEREKIARAMEEVYYPAGSIIFEENDDADSLYIVEQGKVNLTTNDDSTEVIDTLMNLNKRSDEVLKNNHNNETIKQEDNDESKSSLPKYDRQELEIMVNTKEVGDYFGESSLSTNDVTNCVTATVSNDDGATVMKLERVAVQLLLGPVAHIVEKQHNTLRASVKIAKVSSPSIFPRSPKLRGVGVSPGMSPLSSPSSHMPPSMTLNNNDGIIPELSLSSREFVPPINKKQRSMNNSKGSAKTKINVLFYNLEYVGYLGQGTFGIVILVREKITKHMYALKCIDKKKVVNDGHMGHILSEKHVMEMYRSNAFLIRLYCCYQNENWMFFLLEPTLGGDLFLLCKNELHCSERLVRFYAASILLGLEQLHNQNIVYRDLKLENVLIGTDGYCKLGDFGFAKQLRHKNDKTWTLCGTPAYLAPEIISGEGHGIGCDFWALGILVYVMLCRYYPFDDADESVLFDEILHNDVKLQCYFSPEAQSFVDGLLQKNPSRRLGTTHGGFNKIKKHPFFYGFDFDLLAKKEIRAPIIPTIAHEADTRNFSFSLDLMMAEGAFENDYDNDLSFPLREENVHDWASDF